MNTRRLTFVLLLLISAVPTLLFAETIRLRADNWMPFNGDPASGKPGYVVELCKAIYEPLGITVDYQVMPWADALKAAHAGEIEGVIGADPKEGAGLVFPKENINVFRIALFGKKSLVWKLENAASFEKVKIAAAKGYSYFDSLDKHIQVATPPKVVMLTGDNPTVDGIKLLQSGEVELFPENMIVFGYNARALGLKTADFRPCYIHSGEDLYVGFTPKTAIGQRLAKIFDEGIVRLRKSGELAKILANYGVDDWK